jgi:hypothetical protein
MLFAIVTMIVISAKNKNITENRKEIKIKSNDKADTASLKWSL